MLNDNLLGRPIPIGVFWDMENCIVPFKCSALEFVTNLRDRFYDGHFEADFIGVCDIQTQRKSVLIELTYAQVTTVHVCNTCKNAADDKLRLLVRKFANTYPSPATIILITSDINFSPELSDLKYKYNYRTVLIHGRNVSSSLLSIPDEAFYFDGFFTSVDMLSDLTIVDNENILFVRNLPFLNNSESRLKDYLDKLFSTTKGRVLSLAKNIAIIKFPNFEAALRAKARYSNQRIWGKRISITIPNGVLMHRMMSDSLKPLQRPLVASAAKIACDLASGSNDQMFALDNINASCYDELNDILHITPDGKGWRSSDRRYIEDIMSPHSSNKVVVYRDQRNELIQNAFTDRSGHQIVSGGEDHEFSWHKESNFNPKNGRHAIVNRKLFAENEKESWSGSNIPHRFTTPKGYYEAGFRRTPGAHRSSNNNHDHHQELRPKFLFIKNGSRKSLKNVNPTSEKHSNQSFKNWQSVDDRESPGVDLLVSNLDYNISTYEWKKILAVEFHNAQLRSLSVQMQSDNTSIALINVPTMEDAKYLVSHFHKKKIGYKRIQVAIVNSEDLAPQLDSMRLNITSLLSSMPGQKLPLIQFFEMYEKRYQKRLTILDLQDMSDCVKVIEQEGLGKLAVLCSKNIDEREDITPCRHFCSKHVDESLWDGLNVEKNPKMKISLKVLTAHVHKLLQKHDREFPLSSFPACYAQEFSSLKLVLDEGGVSLEHLILCVPGLEIVTRPPGVKHLRCLRNTSNGGRSASEVPVLSDNLKLLNQEISELLINTPKCTIEVSKFSTLYRQYFGRHCRCLDFGCSSFEELFKSLSRSIQLIGSGSSSCITFTHPVQVSRFSSDLNKIFKVQGHKQLDVLDLPTIYNNVIGKPFDITEFGVCFVGDMISELCESTFMVEKIKDSILLSTATKDQLTEANEANREASETTEDVSSNVLLVVMDFSDGCMCFDDLYEVYQNCFRDDIEESFVAEYMGDLVAIQRSPVKGEGSYVKLLPTQMFARDVRRLLLGQQHQQLFLPQFEETYQSFFKMPLKPELYNHESLASLVKDASKVISFDGCLSNWKICLQPKFRTCLKEKDVCTNSHVKDPMRLLDDRRPVRKDSEKRDTTCGGLALIRKLESDSNLFELSKEERRKLKTSFSHTTMSELMTSAAKLLPAEVYKDSKLERRIEDGVNKLHLQMDGQSIIRSKTVDFSLLTDLSASHVERKSDRQRVDPLDIRNSAIGDETDDRKSIESLPSEPALQCGALNNVVDDLENEENRKSSEEKSYPLHQLQLVDDHYYITPSGNSTFSSVISHSTAVVPPRSILKKSRIAAKINLTSLNCTE